MSGQCDGMFWSLHVQIEQARQQRAEITHVMWDSGEEDGMDPQRAASAVHESLH